MTDGCSQASEESIKYRKTIFDKSMVLFCFVLSLSADARQVESCLFDRYSQARRNRALQR